MKSSVTRELFAYWKTLHRGNRTPHFESLDPGAIRKHLADIFVLTFDSAEGHPFRLAGTSVCALFACELKASPFVSLWDPGQRQTLLQTIQAVAEETAGFVAGASGASAEGDGINIEMLLLPLVGDDGLPARIVGALGPIQPPFWVGFRPLCSLSLDGGRFVRRGDAPHMLRKAGPEAAQRGRSLVFYPASLSPISRNYQG